MDLQLRYRVDKITFLEEVCISFEEMRNTEAKFNDFSWDQIWKLSLALSKIKIQSNQLK